MTHFPMLCKARWAQMPAERAHTFLATPSRMQNHRSKERRAAQRRLYSRLSTLKRRTSCGRGTPCINTISEAIPSIMLRETPDDRRVAVPGLHLTHGRVSCMTLLWSFGIFVAPRRVAFVSLEFYRVPHAHYTAMTRRECVGEATSENANA